jgi:hypothetical protein
MRAGGKLPPAKRQVSGSGSHYYATPAPSAGVIRLIPRPFAFVDTYTKAQTVECVCGPEFDESSEFALELLNTSLVPDRLPQSRVGSPFSRRLR